MNVKITVLVLCCAISTIVGEEFYTIDGREYYLSYPLQLSWIRALRYCTYMGMYLVDVRNSLENHRILSVMAKINEQYNVSHPEYWTSGTDQGKEGDYYWATTGHPIMYENWYVNEPSGSPTENCIHYMKTKLQWNDAPCDLEKCFICRDYFDMPSKKTCEYPNSGSKY